MTEIIPAIMPTSFSDLEDKLGLVASHVSLVQIDVMDGRLTPAKTWPYATGELDKNFVKIIQEEEGFPFWNDVDFEADLMVREPEKIWRDWVSAGAKRLIFHLESLAQPEEFLDMMRKNAVAKDSPLYTEIGLAIRISTDNDVLYPLIPHIDFVQCMGIMEIGVQGSAFDERVLEKVADLRAKFPELIISVDGGVNMETVPRLIEAGVNRLAIGSAIFAAEHPEDALKAFQHNE